MTFDMAGSPAEWEKTNSPDQKNTRQISYSLDIVRNTAPTGDTHAELFKQAKNVLNGTRWSDALPVESSAVSVLCEAVKPYILHNGNEFLVYNELTGAFEHDEHTPYELAGTLAAAWLLACTGHGGTQVFNFAKYLDGNKGRRAVLAGLSHKKDIVCKPTDFDALPYMLNCAGLAMDLRTGECRSTKPADRFMQNTKCRPQEGATQETDKFLQWATKNDTELTAYLWRLAGYCITGETAEQCFWNFYGSGKNGKGTWTRLIQKAMGDYSGEVPETLIVKQYNKNFDAPAIVGKRLAIGADIGSGTLDLPFIKALTGGDAVKIEAKNKNSFMYNPTAKLVYSSNVELRLSETGDAVDRRVRRVPFKEKVETPDAGLEKRLAAEAPHVLHRLIQEARAWYAADAANLPRFPPCPAVDRESKEYTESQNIALEFVSERCERVDGERVSGKELYEAFVQWRIAGKNKPEKNQAFYKALQDGGFEKIDYRHTPVFMGLRLVLPENNGAGGFDFTKPTNEPRPKESKYTSKCPKCGMNVFVERAGEPVKNHYRCGFEA
jgi:putative DNA primase/helicase